MQNGKAFQWMLQMKIRTRVFKFFLSAVLLVITSNLFAENTETESKWIIAAKRFEFVQKASRTKDEQASANLIPSLILEEISESAVREILPEEKNQRVLETLMTERLSYFLDLSKEIKVRDSLVLENMPMVKFQHKLKEEQKKLDEIQKRLDENLLKQKEILHPELISRKNRKKKSEVIEPEHIAIYKDNNEVLFEGPDGEEMNSWKFQKAVLAENINGIISGSIVVYGEYAAVTAELIVYPGAVKSGSVTEIGSLREPQVLAENIAFALMPKIANGLPVELEFHKERLPENSRLTIDNVVYEPFPDKAIVNAGVHTISVEAEDYERETFIYGFSGAKNFIIDIELNKKNQSELGLVFKKFLEGDIFFDGLGAGKTRQGKWINAPVKINGNAVLGHFEGKVIPKKSRTKKKTMVTDSVAVAMENSPEENLNQEEISKDISEEVPEEIPEENNVPSVKGEGFELDENEEAVETMFFFIAPEYLVEGNRLEANVKLFDVSGNIDKRRRMMYISYSALIVSLPFLFYSYGNFNSSYHGYISTQGNVPWTDVEKYQGMSFAAIGLTVACGTWFAIELVRYLLAVNKVLPVNAHPASKKTISRMELEALRLQNELEAQQIEEINSEEKE